MRLVNTLLVLFLGILLFSCNKSEDTVSSFSVTPYPEQYAKDIAAIDKFLDGYKMTIINNDNVQFSELAAPIDVSQTIRVQHAAKLNYKTVASNGVDYKVYFINLNQGTQEQPTPVDSVFVSYRGLLLNKKSTTEYNTSRTFDENQTFDQATSPMWLTLDGVITAWKEIISLFKSGEVGVSSGNNVLQFTNFGAGVMFVPSGLGYYNQSKTGIPAYSPLIFSFSLKKVNYVDHDFDGIDSKFEEFEYTYNVSRGFWEWVAKQKNTDGDSLLDYRDRDDDGDGHLTKEEIRKPSPLSIGQGTSPFYPFNAIADNPATAADESEPKGIPDSSGDGVTSTRVRRHLDKNAKPPYTTY